MASPSTIRSEQEIFDDLEDLCASQGYIHVLALLLLRDNMVTFGGRLTSDDLAASYASGRTVRPEFATLLGLLLKQGIDARRPPLSCLQTFTARTRALLDELHECLGRPMLAAITASHVSKEGRPSIDDGEVFARGDVMREPIFYGGDSAYSFQYRDLALERYVADDAWLAKNKGFGIRDAQAVAAALSRLATEKLTRILHPVGRRATTAPEVLPGFCFSLDDAVAESSLDPDVVGAVLGHSRHRSRPPTQASRR